MPSTEVCPREGSLRLASFGSIRNVHETALCAVALAAGRKSVALKRIMEATLESRLPTFVVLVDELFVIVFIQKYHALHFAG